MAGRFVLVKKASKIILSLNFLFIASIADPYAAHAVSLKKFFGLERKKNSTTAACEALILSPQVQVMAERFSGERLQRLFDYERDARHREWSRYLHGSPPEGYSVVVWRISKVKTVNEEILHMNGNEALLETTLSSTYKQLSLNPDGGKLMVNTHNTFIFLTKLSAEALKKTVVDATIAETAAHMRKIRDDKDIPWEQWAEPGSGIRDWESWIRAHSFVESDSTIVRATLKLAFQDARYQTDFSRMTIEDWIVASKSKQAYLAEQARLRNVDYKMLLDGMYRGLGRSQVEEASFKTWLERRRLGHLLPELKVYFDYLRVADFYPLPEEAPIPETLQNYIEAKKLSKGVGRSKTNWSLDQQAFVQQALENAEFVAALDGKKFSRLAFFARDQWVRAGADLSTIQDIYSPITKAFEKETSKMHDDLQLKIDSNSNLKLTGLLLPSGQVKFVGYQGKKSSDSDNVSPAGKVTLSGKVSIEKQTIQLTGTLGAEGRVKLEGTFDSRTDRIELRAAGIKGFKGHVRLDGKLNRATGEISLAGVVEAEGKVLMYATGDDMIIVFPAMDAEVRRRVSHYFKELNSKADASLDSADHRFKFHNSGLVKIPEIKGMSKLESFSSALTFARNKLFESKKPRKRRESSAKGSNPRSASDELPSGQEDPQASYFFDFSRNAMNLSRFASLSSAKNAMWSPRSVGQNSFALVASSKIS